MEKVSPAVRRFSTGELTLVLFGLAVLGFGIGLGLAWSGLGWGLVPVAAVLIGFALTLAMSRTRGPVPTRPTVTMDSAEAMPKLQIGSMPPPRAVHYYMSAIGGAALALTLAALVMLAMPGDVTALVLLGIGVVGWTAVVLVSLHLQLRR